VPRAFPHQLSWLIDNPVHSLLLSPRRLADRLPLAETSQVLEVGPGSGFFSPEIARRVLLGRLHLLDIQSEMLAKARTKLEARGLRDVLYTTGPADGIRSHR